MKVGLKSERDKLREAMRKYNLDELDIGRKVSDMGERSARMLRLKIEKSKGIV